MCLPEIDRKVTHLIYKNKIIFIIILQKSAATCLQNSAAVPSPRKLRQADGGGRGHIQALDRIAAVEGY